MLGSAQAASTGLVLWRLLLAHLFPRSLNKNSQTIQLTPAFLGQFFFSTLNICRDFQGLFRIHFVQWVPNPGRTQLSDAENHAVAVGKPNSPDIAPLQVSLTVHFGG